MDKIEYLRAWRKRQHKGYAKKYYEKKKKQITGNCTICKTELHFPQEKYCSRKCIAQGFIGHKRLQGRTMTQEHRNAISMALKGRKLSPEHIKRIKETRHKGEQAHNWKGGRRIEKGYVYIRKPEHPKNKDGYIAEHRFVAEQITGRQLESWEHVHHKNRQRDDNRPENLLIVTRREHKRLEGKVCVICPFCQKEFGLN